ncbi:MAG: hypothetical protein HEP71_34630 [Roseivirga sp.]|nr:hypothetical protein [Roseivirga sp.]
MTDYLNNALPKKANGNSRFSNSSVQPKGYFIFDLTDTTNATIKSSGHIDFREGHVYHFCPFRIWNSVSHIMILHKGELKIFRALNCDNKGDTVDEVLDYLKADYSNQKELLLRVENYRSYGLYRKRHGNNSFNCEIYIEN